MTSLERISLWIVSHEESNVKISYADYLESNMWSFESIEDVDKCANEFKRFFEGEVIFAKEILKKIEDCRRQDFVERVCDMLWDLVAEGVL